VKLGILTDGLIYQLYSDTEEENLMDNEPFAVVDLAQAAQEQIADDAFDALLKLRSDTFDPADIGADARRKIFISAYVNRPCNPSGSSDSSGTGNQLTGTPVPLREMCSTSVIDSS
jgi:hypothetical protein